VLELELVNPEAAAPGLAPWPLHPRLDGPLTETEQEALAALAADDPARDWAPALLNLRLRLLHLFDLDWTPPDLVDDLLRLARLPLARLRIATTDPADLVETLTADRVRVDNLARPFLSTAAQLAWLAGQGS
jgi:hypothetical protein